VFPNHKQRARQQCLAQQTRFEFIFHEERILMMAECNAKDEREIPVPELQNSPPL
jgi:hypothetical protein